jgi:hypothetical protein
MAAVSIRSESDGNLEESCTFRIEYATYIDTEGPVTEPQPRVGACATHRMLCLTERILRCVSSVFWNCCKTSAANDEIRFGNYAISSSPHLQLSACSPSFSGLSQRRLGVFENRVLRRIFGPNRDEMAGDWRKLHNEELHSLYSCWRFLNPLKPSG